MLAGRDELLVRLDDLLTGQAGSWPRIAVLSGLGGIGKTSVAVEYAHRHLAEFGVVWQLAAEDPAVLMAGMAELAAQLGARAQADLRDPVASVHAALAACPAPWLLIFDNAHDERSARAVVPPAGRGRVRLESRAAAARHGRRGWLSALAAWSAR
jgi:hypothetical protein